MTFHPHFVIHLAFHILPRRSFNQVLFIRVSATSYAFRVIFHPSDFHPSFGHFIRSPGAPSSKCFSSKGDLSSNCFSSTTLCHFIHFLPLLQVPTSSTSAFHPSFMFQHLLLPPFLPPSFIQLPPSKFHPPRQLHLSATPGALLFIQVLCSGIHLLFIQVLCIFIHSLNALSSK